MSKTSMKKAWTIHYHTSELIVQPQVSLHSKISAVDRAVGRLSFTNSIPPFEIVRQEPVTQSPASCIPAIHRSYKIEHRFV